MECIVRDDAALTPHNPVDLTGHAWSMHSKLVHSKSCPNHPKLRHYIYEDFVGEMREIL